MVPLLLRPLLVPKPAQFSKPDPLVAHPLAVAARLRPGVAHPPRLALKNLAHPVGGLARLVPLVFVIPAAVEAFG